jgi:hypothetical protein
MEIKHINCTYTKGELDCENCEDFINYATLPSSECNNGVLFNGTNQEILNLHNKMVELIEKVK